MQTTQALYHASTFDANNVRVWPSGMKVFVAGAAGFIGSHLVRRLLADAEVESVVAFDNFSSGRRDYLPAGPAERLRVIEGDLKSCTSIAEAMNGCDVVYHLAANPDISKAVTEPQIDFWEGTYLTQNLLEAMRTTSARKILYTSGSGVYGENPSVAFAEDYGPCIPISTYGASKLACEALIAAYCHMFGLVGRAFRFANVVGPRQTHGVGYDFIRRLHRSASELTILGDGSQSKSYIYIDDVLSAIALADSRTMGAYDVFNVATEDYITVREIADAAVRVSGLDRATVHYRFTGSDRGWKGDVPVVRFDCSKIRALGWQCTKGSAKAIEAAMVAMKNELING